METNIMNLISILITLAIEHYYSAVQSLRRYNWFRNYSSALYAKLAGQEWRNGPFGILLIIGSILFAVWLISAMLASVAVFLAFLFATCVLIYTLGPVDLSQQVKDYSEAVHNKDEDAIRDIARQILGCSRSKLSTLSPNEIGQMVQRAVLNESITRIFGIILWFMVLGPLGAALLRMACELKKYHSLMGDGFEKSINDLVEILNWLPVRLTVIGFALAGSFTDTVSRWTSLTDFWKDDNETLLIDSAMGAIQNEPIDDDEENDCLEAIHRTLALAKRTLVVWIAVIAILTLTGWVF
jgi:membrane protein required for beta-lactamase induction